MATRMELLLDGKRDVMRYVERLEYAEAIDDLDALSVEMSVHTTGDADTLVGMVVPGAEFTVELYEDKTAKSELLGDLVEVEHIKHMRGGYEIRAVGLDALHRLRSRKPAEIMEANAKDVVSAIAKRHKLKVKADAVDTSVAWELLDNEDDAIYVKNYARKHNYFVRVVGDELQFKKRVAAGAVTCTWGEDILDLSLRSNITGLVSKVTVMGFDMLTEKDVKGEAKNTDVQGISDGDVGVDLAKKAFGESELILNQSGYINPKDAKSRAVAELQRRAENFVQGTCVVVGNPLALSGAKLTIKQAGWPFSGDFLIRQTRHVQDASQGYRTYIDFVSDALPKK